MLVMLRVRNLNEVMEILIKSSSPFPNVFCWPQYFPPLQLCNVVAHLVPALNGAVEWMHDGIKWMIYIGRLIFTFSGLRFLNCIMSMT